jgi:hypothetical protein
VYRPGATVDSQALDGSACSKESPPTGAIGAEHVLWNRVECRRFRALLREGVHERLDGLGKRVSPEQRRPLV